MVFNRQNIRYTYFWIAMTPEAAFQMFLALKLHFTTKYDYFKYNGKTRADVQGVQYRRDKWNYVKIAKKYEDNLQMQSYKNIQTK